MGKEFNLSERIIAEEFDKWGNRGYPIFHSAILKEDVKEFIKRLKEFTLNEQDPTLGEIRGTEVRDEIDKLAGEKLI